MAGSCAEVLRLGMSADEADVKKATRLMSETCDPGLNKSVLEISALTNKLTKETDKASDRAAETTNETILDTYLFVLFAALAAGGLTTLLTMAGVTKPLRAIVATLEKLSLGDMDTKIPGGERRDEIGMISRAALRFHAQTLEMRRNLKALDNAEQYAAQAQRDKEEKARAAEELSSVLQQLGAALRSLSGGDLALRLTEAFPEAYVQLRDDFNAAVSSLRETMSSVTDTAHAISSNSGEIAKAADDLSKRTERQAASLEETAAALQEITETVKSTAQGAQHARDVVSSAKTDAETGREVMDQAIEAMGGISKSSKQIGHIVTVIDEIAFQTNLLALNAGVEAARAATPGAASPSSPPKCAPWRNAPPPRRRRSRR